MSRSFSLFLLVLILGCSTTGVASADIEQIEHVIIFMQENRAFDHYFGSLPGVRGFNDRAAPPLPSGLPVWYQPLNDDNTSSYMLPWHVNSLRTSATCMSAPAMGWSPDQEMFNNGLNDAWNTARDPGYGMGYFERTDLPYYYALADAFTIGDQYFQSVFSSTNPNRLFLFSGSNGLSAGHAPATDNTEPIPGFQWKTSAEIMQASNVSWRVYQQVDNFDDNAFAWFEAFQVALPGNPLYDLGKKPVPNIVTALSNDMDAGTLAQVSIIIAPEPLSEHANNHPAAGEDLSARLIQVLQSHPDIYAKTAFILNYDEGGQFWDHQWPPTPPVNDTDGVSTVNVTDELVVGIETVGPSTPYGPIGMGWRVPIIIVSPWTRGGVINSQVFDHTSVLQFLELRFNISFPAISQWRRTVAGNLTSFFDWDNPDYSWPTLPNTNGYVAEADQQCATLPMPQVPSTQSLPAQEPGVRPSRTLPYQLYVFDSFSQGIVSLEIASNGKAGAAFQLYDMSNPNRAPKKYTVSAGMTLVDALPADPAYNFSLHGANGFVRQFSGVANGPSFTCTVQQLPYDLVNGALMLSFNAQGGMCTFSVTQNAYTSSTTPQMIKVAAGSNMHFNLSVASSGNWYDLTVSVVGQNYVRRLMGRIERSGCTSDPAAAGTSSAFPFEHPGSHPRIPEQFRTFVDRRAGTHKDHRCFDAHDEKYFQALCVDQIPFRFEGQ